MQQENYHCGDGKFSFPNGDTYEGQYCAHRSGILWREGYGKYTTHDGQTYVGHWKDDKLTETVNILYSSGSEFYGSLTKNKYNGNGIYKFENNLQLNCEFLDNRPIGQLLLLDTTDHVWYGKAETENATFYQENVFYTSLCDDKGVGQKKEPPRFERLAKPPPQSTTTRKKRSLTREEDVFAKSTKTPNDTDDRPSQWDEDYENFARTKETVARKIELSGVGSLDEREKAWWSRYSRFVDRIHASQTDDGKKIKRHSYSVGADREGIERGASHTFDVAVSRRKSRVLYPTGVWNGTGDTKFTDQFDARTSLDTVKRIFAYYEGHGKFDACVTTSDDEEFNPPVKRDDNVDADCD